MAAPSDLPYITWGDQVVIRSKAKPYAYLRVTPVLARHKWGDLGEATVFTVWRCSTAYVRAVEKHRAYARPIKLVESWNRRVVEPPEED